MAEKRYKVKSIFRTVQGEGSWAGHAAVFVRFAGCNVWSGREEHRARDKRNGLCAEWCDTDFVGTNGYLGGSYTGDSLAGVIARMFEFAANHKNGTARKLVVFTGGEPSLQLDEDLVSAVRQLCPGCFLCVETNGVKALPSVDWITLSPKPPLEVNEETLRRASEVKIVYPAVTEEHIRFFETLYAKTPVTLWAQPQAFVGGAVDEKATKATLDFVTRNPLWRMSTQTHKYIGAP